MKSGSKRRIFEINSCVIDSPMDSIREVQDVLRKLDSILDRELSNADRFTIKHLNDRRYWHNGWVCNSLLFCSISAHCISTIFSYKYSRNNISVISESSECSWKLVIFRELLQLIGLTFLIYLAVQIDIS
ncbi:hypothetical protein GJ496_001988 [Pomphorhynchus laevis]|nr:hypothetical protein GJ496_001988 [Pomphorhynchus laevis]